MVIIDHGGRIVLVNSQTEPLFGYTRQELLGREVEILVPERFRAAHPAHRQRFLRRAAGAADGRGRRELYGLRKDGSEFPVEISLSPIETEDGVLVSSAIRDVTERKRTDEVLRQRTDRTRSGQQGARSLLLLGFARPARPPAGDRRLLAHPARGLRANRCPTTPRTT